MIGRNGNRFLNVTMGILEMNKRISKSKNSEQPIGGAPRSIYQDGKELINDDVLNFDGICSSLRMADYYSKHPNNVVNETFFMSRQIKNIVESRPLHVMFCEKNPKSDHDFFESMIEAMEEIRERG